MLLEADVDTNAIEGGIVADGAVWEVHVDEDRDSEHLDADFEVARGGAGGVGTEQDGLVVMSCNWDISSNSNNGKTN